jgi:hypothetical protein
MNTLSSLHVTRARAQLALFGKAPDTLALALPRHPIRWWRRLVSEPNLNNISKITSTWELNINSKGKKEKNQDSEEDN